MINFNYVLFALDVLFISSPFIVADLGYYESSFFFLGFAVCWLLLNIKNKKVNLKRYKLY